MRFVLAVGTTRTAAIEGISAAGADIEAMEHTPAADAELLAYGRPVTAPAVPVAPSGTVTPAMVTRAVRELVGFELLVLDAGLAVPTGAPTVTVGSRPGADVREPIAVPDARSIYESARALGAALPDEEVVVAESIPGGTTTALGVLRALGEPFGVSSSLPENPIELKWNVVQRGLDRSDLTEGAADGDPMAAVRAMGDPVLAAVAGFVEGAVRSGTAVTLAGGTQQVAAAALVRHAGIADPLSLATTSYIADDESVDLRDGARALGLELVVTDPELEGVDHPALAGYRAGDVKEGVGMGGALHLAVSSGFSMSEVRRRTIERYDATVVDGGP